MSSLRTTFCHRRSLSFFSLRKKALFSSCAVINLDLIAPQTLCGIGVAWHTSNDEGFAIHCESIMRVQAENDHFAPGLVPSLLKQSLVEFARSCGVIIAHLQGLRPLRPMLLGLPTGARKRPVVGA